MFCNGPGGNKWARTDVVEHVGWRLADPSLHKSEGDVNKICRPIDVFLVTKAIGGAFGRPRILFSSQAPPPHAMSSVRNAVQRRNHKERSQPAHRQRYGLLEKHKDYVLRAKDYHFKQDRLKALRERAQFKNPDEFYFKMISTKTKNGVHIAERNNQLPDDMVQLLKSQDYNYIRTQREVSKKKIEKLQDSLQFLEADDSEEDEEDAEMVEGGPSDAGHVKKPTHIVFVDSEEQAKKFDPAKHLDTLPELVNRTFNRPRIETLKQQAVATPQGKDDLQRIQKSREMKYRELSSRIERETKLQQLERELVVQKALMGKGRRKKVGTDKNGLAIYKWKADRKK